MGAKPSTESEKSWVDKSTKTPVSQCSIPAVEHYARHIQEHYSEKNPMDKFKRPMEVRYEGAKHRTSIDSSFPQDRDSQLYGRSGIKNNLKEDSQHKEHTMEHGVMTQKTEIPSQPHAKFDAKQSVGSTNPTPQGSHETGLNRSTSMKNNRTVITTNYIPCMESVENLVADSSSTAVAQVGVPHSFTNMDATNMSSESKDVNEEDKISSKKDNVDDHHVESKMKHQSMYPDEGKTPWTVSKLIEHSPLKHIVHHRQDHQQELVHKLRQEGILQVRSKEGINKDLKLRQDKQLKELKEIGLLPGSVNNEDDDQEDDDPNSDLEKQLLPSKSSDEWDMSSGRQNPYKNKREPMSKQQEPPRLSSLNSIFSSSNSVGFKSKYDNNAAQNSTRNNAMDFKNDLKNPDGKTKSGPQLGPLPGLPQKNSDDTVRSHQESIERLMLELELH